jgi:hypothetical protein
MSSCFEFGRIGMVGDVHVGIGDPGVMLVGGVIVAVISFFHEEPLGSGVFGSESDSVSR